MFVKIIKFDHGIKPVWILHSWPGNRVGAIISTVIEFSFQLFSLFSPQKEGM